MTLKETKLAATHNLLHLDIRNKHDFKQAKVYYKNSTYAEIEGIKVKWDVVHKYANSRFVLKLV